MKNKGYWKSPVVNIYHISEEKKVRVLYNTALYRKIILIDLGQERLESMSNPIFWCSVGTLFSKLVALNLFVHLVCKLLIFLSKS